MPPTPRAHAHAQDRGQFERVQAFVETIDSDLVSAFLDHFHPKLHSKAVFVAMSLGIKEIQASSLLRGGRLVKDERELLRLTSVDLDDETHELDTVKTQKSEKSVSFKPTVKDAATTPLLVDSVGQTATVVPQPQATPSQSQRPRAKLVAISTETQTPPKTIGVPFKKQIYPQWWGHHEHTPSKWDNEGNLLLSTTSPITDGVSPTWKFPKRMVDEMTQTPPAPSNNNKSQPSQKTKTLLSDTQSTDTWSSYMNTESTGINTTTTASRVSTVASRIPKARPVLSETALPQPKRQSASNGSKKGTEWFTVPLHGTAIQTEEFETSDKENVVEPVLSESSQSKTITRKSAPGLIKSKTTAERKSAPAKTYGESTTSQTQTTILPPTTLAPTTEVNIFEIARDVLNSSFVQCLDLEVLENDNSILANTSFE